MDKNDGIQTIDLLSLEHISVLLLIFVCNKEVTLDSFLRRESASKRSELTGCFPPSFFSFLPVKSIAETLIEQEDLCVYDPYLLAHLL